MHYNKTNPPLSNTSVVGMGFEKIKQGLWKRDDITVTYDGAIWLINGKRIEYLMDLFIELENIKYSRDVFVTFRKTNERKTNNMNFTAKNRHYEIDQFGVITQTDHRPFVYDPAYSAIYDKPEYKRGSEILQALRYGFICAAHGRRINSVLDCGYGNGAFMKFIKQHVPYVYGHDVTGVAVDSCYILPELLKADVVCFWDCIEHIADLSFVKDLPHETLVISLPYCHFITQGKEWFETQYKHLKPDEHIHHFNEHSLGSAMSHYGWRTVAVSGHEDIIRKSEHGLQNILTMAFKRK